jgi:hypothetical protein
MSTLNNIRRAELKRLLRHRGVSDIIVHNEVEDILAERIRWTSTALGERMQLSFKERDHLGIRTIACIDLSKKMVREYYLRRKRERDRVRAYRMRAQVRKAKVLPRATQLAAVVKGDWTPIAPLAGILQKRNGWPRKHDAAAKALRRAALELSKAELGFELKTEPGPRGGYLTFVRRSPATMRVSKDQSATSPNKTRAARSGDSNLSVGQCPPDKNMSPHRRNVGKRAGLGIAPSTTTGVASQTFSIRRLS